VATEAAQPDRIVAHSCAVELYGVPSIVVLGGPNGAGKTTAAPFLMRDALGVREYVNADPIAAGLSAFAPESVAIEAGRVMLARLAELARLRTSFGFETTLASRSFAPWLRLRLAEGYGVHLVFLWLASPELALARVARRVELGGHSVPDDVVQRRYAAGLRNFFGLYRPIMSTWQFYDNSDLPDPRLIATGQGDAAQVSQPDLWATIVRQWAGAHD
jgi:predicted ABC-type ATPase